MVRKEYTLEQIIDKPIEAEACSVTRGLFQVEFDSTPSPPETKMGPDGVH